MKPDQFVRDVTNPSAWRQQSSIMRLSAEALWDQFELSLVKSCLNRVLDDTVFQVALSYMRTSVLLYGLVLEKALKAEIVEGNPDNIELKFQRDGEGRLMRVHIKNLGVANGHDLVALAEKAGIFGEKFANILVDERGAFAVREICKHLTEIVVWQGRYPVPMSSREPVRFDRSLPLVLQNHYIRDVLDPMLDSLKISPQSKVLSLLRISVNVPTRSGLSRPLAHEMVLRG